jgi:hypothetical protein
MYLIFMYLTPCDITNQGKYTKLRNMRNDMTSFFDR